MAELEVKGKEQTWGAILGIALFVGVLAAPAPADMPPQAWRVAAVAVLMAVWWTTEALPLPVTALTPIILFPLLGISSLLDAASPYADPIIFLLLGGFILGAAMQRWSLHKRIGLLAILYIGTTPSRLIGGFMLGTALLSMWVSNSATAIMMLPVAVSIAALFDSQDPAARTAHRNFSVALVLAVAYGASIGGLGTLIGTPPNAVLAAYMAREHGVTIGFAQWMALALPLVAVMLVGTWIILVRLHPVEGNIGGNAELLVRTELREMGPLTSADYRVASVFCATALAWVLRPVYSDFVPGLEDSQIAILSAVALFLLPSGMPAGGRLLAWDDLKELPWGVLILLGGGLSLAGAISSSGLAVWLGAIMGAMADWPVLLIIVTATVGMIFLTELTSNTASAATFLPIGAALAVGIGLDPIVLTVPLALAASCAFMLPVATPPNAIVFASGRITIRQMVYAGLWINMFGSIAVAGISYFLASALFGR
jgi:solute carrier family 13 (sodium-dependent dicarboxylate transporter), member 2/3/5